MARLGERATMVEPADKNERADLEATQSVRRTLPKKRKRWTPPKRGGGLSDAMAAFMFVLIAGGSGLLIEAGGIPSPARPVIFAGMVARIVDGDTFEMTGAPGRVRIWGLEAPERDAPGGAEATRALKTIAAGQNVSCAQIDVDDAGRIVARCALSSGEDLAALMIRSGTAEKTLRLPGARFARRHTASGADASALRE